MKWSLSVALLLVVLAGTSSANEYVWREAENATATTFNHSGWYQDGDSNFVVDKTLFSPGMPGGTAGDWRVHYVSGSSSAYIEWNNISVSEGGTYTLWARMATTNTAYTYSVDGGAAQSVDMGHQHETINIIRYGPNPIDDVHYVGWVRVGDVNLSPGTHTVRITVVYYSPHGSTYGGVDCIGLVNFPWTPTGTLQPTGSSTNPDPTPGAGVWFPLHVAEDSFSANSIIDMHDVVAATTGIPAGTYGHVARVDDHFELSGRPGTAVKFWGVCATHPSSTSLFNQQARTYLKYGVNLVRRHPMISELGQSMSAGALDTYDRWFAALKSNGIYTDWSVFYPDNAAVTRSFLPTTPSAEFTALLSRTGITVDDLWNELPGGGGSSKKLGGFDCFVEWYQAGEWNWEQTLLNHTNPYTGLKYVNDPALAVVEVQNEDSIFWHWPLSELATGTNYPDHTLLLRRMWFEWLQDRYATDAALAAAWGAGMRAGDSVVTFNPSIKLYAAWEMEADGPFTNKSTEKARMGDWIRFLAETQRAIYQTRFDNLTALGYQGIKVSTAWKAGGPAAEAANLWTDDAGDAIDRHAYTGGGAGGYYVAPGSVDNSTHLNQPGHGILGGESIDAGGSPVSVFQVEDKPAMMTEWNQNPPNQWRAEISPLFAFYGMGLQGWDASLHFAGSYAWMETGWPGSGFGPGSYVDETPLYMGQYPALAFALYNGHIQQGAAAAARRTSVDDMFRGIDPLSQNLPDGGFPGQSNIYAPPEITAIGRLSYKADASLSSSDSQKVDWTTYWDQTNKIITSTTGQLVWNYNSKVVQVKSTRSQGLIGWAGGKGPYSLPGVQVSVDAATPFCSLLFTPLDDEPLVDSQHILITAVAQDKQAGTSYNGSGTTLNSVGGPPLYLQPVQATITLGGNAIESVKSVDIYGVPTSTELPLAGNTFTINGNYTSIYYEINRSSVPTPTIALNKTSLTPSCVEGSDPSDGSFQVWDTGDAQLNYTISDDAGWLSVDPTSGSSDDSSDKQTHTVHYDASGLTPDQYTATITVTDAAATNSPQTISVTLTVEAPRSISLSTDTLSPFCVQGSDAPDQSFQVWNGGEGTLDYTVSGDVGWLAVSPDNGSSADAAHKVSHTVTYTNSGLLPLGGHDATITVTDPNATNSPATVSVHLSVLSGPPAISASAASFSPTCLAGEDAASEPLDIWNSGDGTLNYTAYTSVASGGSWLSVSPGSGSSADAAHKVSHTVNFVTSGLSAGNYSGTIFISSPGAADPLVSIPVSLSVTSQGSIGVDKASLSPTCLPGTSPPSDQLQVWNVSDGTMDYTISDNAAWLSVTPTDGTTTGPGDVQAHTVNYSTGGLGAGAHDATITIAAVGADNTPLHIPVHLVVQDSGGPAIQITWPTEADSPLSDPLITVTGTASDASGVAAIWVNGVLARNTGTGFSTWEATIPLSQGFDADDANCTNLITACAVDDLGNYSADADSVTVDSIGDGGRVQLVSLSFQAVGAVVPGDVDTFQFEAAAGTALSLALKGSGKPAPNLKLELYGVDGQKLLTQTGGKIGIKQEVPECGLYMARVLLAGGGGGQYTIKLSGKPPKSKMKVSGNLATGGSVDDHYMSMPRGALVAASVSSKAFDPVLKIMDPIGGTIPLGGYLSASGGKAQVKNMPLPNGPEPYLTGDYTIEVSSGNGGSGAFTLAGGAKAPKAAKEKVAYPALLGTSASKGVPRGGVVQLKVVGASDTAADNTIYMDGRALSPDSVSLKSGKGTLNVTVPSDMVVGSVEVYFVRSDSEVDEKSNALDMTVVGP